MPSYLVETYLARGHGGDRAAYEQRERLAAKELTHGTARVCFDQSIHVPEDEICFYVFDAPSARVAAQVAQRARSRCHPPRRSGLVRKGGGMMRKPIWALVLALIGVVMYAGNVMATPSSGFSGTTLARATYAEIFSHVQTQDPHFWNEAILTRGASDLYVQQNTWQPGGSTGWHTHPGPSFIIVTQGSVTVYDGDDQTCTPQEYTAGTATNAFIDSGDGHVHIIRNETSTVAQTITVQLIPAGATRRQDVTPAPSNCPF